MAVQVLTHEPLFSHCDFPIIQEMREDPFYRRLLVLIRHEFTISMMIIALINIFVLFCQVIKAIISDDYPELNGLFLIEEFLPKNMIISAFHIDVYSIQFLYYWNQFLVNLFAYLILGVQYE